VWFCKECKYTTEWTMKDVENRGTPVCLECDVDMNWIDTEICYECGRSVKGGSGRFANRIPSLDSYEERVDMGVQYPEGEWLCDECDQHAQDGDEEYFSKFTRE